MSFFDSILPSVPGATTTANPIDINLYLICLAYALGCGVITAIGAAIRTRSTRSFLLSVTLLPMIVCTVIMMVNGQVGTGVAVMGAFSLIRFRSVPGKARDIVAIFLSMTAGLACSCGFVGIALVFTVIVSALMVGFSFLPVGSERCMDMRITIPESLSFSGAFDDLFEQYTRSCRLVRARTANMGSLYKLEYRVRLKNVSQMQNFIDALRCRNGNLEISISELLERQEEL